MGTKQKRVGNTRTFGISVDEETEKFLRDEAQARFDGNVSRFVAALARDEKSRRAAEQLLRDAAYTPMSDAEAMRFIAGLREPKRRKKSKKKRAA